MRMEALEMSRSIAAEYYAKRAALRLTFFSSAYHSYLLLNTIVLLGMP